jgi:recombination protein RecR
MQRSFSPLIDKLIESLRFLPGIGPKSAQRIAFYLLERQRENALKLAENLQEAMLNIRHCTLCRNFSETDICKLCDHPGRLTTQLCIVETPLDVLAIEQTGQYKGYYFVLQGHLSPLDGIGPQELGLNKLVERIENQPPKEIIIATNPTVEGEVTAHHIAKLLKPFQLTITRIAHGVPMGSEIEYAGETTLAHSFNKRTEMGD